MWIRAVLLSAAGFCAGTMVAAGFFAFITAIGVVTTYAQRTHTAKHIKLYETTLATGAILCNAWWTLGFQIKLGALSDFMIAVSGICYGIFVGSLIIALAETIQTIPVFFRRAKITTGLSVIVIAFAIGKCVGNILFYILKMAV